jgi:hypothetical protein
VHSIENMERKREARRLLRARRQRVGQLRGRVVAISLVSFVLLWGVVFAQMATGNDPVLGERPPRTDASKAAPRAPTPEAAEEEPVEVEVEPVPEPEPEPAPVVTSQS